MTKVEKEVIAKAVNEKWLELAKETYRDRVNRGVAGGGYVEQELQLAETEPYYLKALRAEWCALNELAKILNVDCGYHAEANKYNVAAYAFLKYGETL